MTAYPPQKRVLAIHDLSGFGRCSLSVALPVLSAMGIECVCVPTAALSAHTGIEGYHCRELTEDLPAVLEHYRRLGLHFDAIYSGFLASGRQIELVRAFVDEFRADDTLFVCDPVMGDEGELYPVFDAGFAEQMRSLCAVADVIVPNLTEAALLLGGAAGKLSNPRRDIIALRELGAAAVVLTGVSGGGEVGALGMDASGKLCESYAAKSPGSFSGSGDVFASVLTGALVRGASLAQAIGTAVDFTAEAIAYTAEHGGNPLHGLMFEPLLGRLFLV
jgi:pyridoxine kinase